MSEDQTSLPPLSDESAFVLLQDWYVEKRQLSEMKQHEHLTRVRLSEFYFPEPKEGTTRRPASPGFDLKLVYSMNYKVDVAALDQIDAAKAKKLGIVLDDLFEYKPQLKVGAFKKLTPEQRAFVEPLLDITPGSPQLDIVPASQKDAEAAALAETAPQTPPVLPPQPAPVAEVAGPQIRDNIEDCQPGDYYQDGDGDWWVCLKSVGSTENGAGEWDNVAEPTHLLKPKPRRGRKAK